MSDGYHSCYVLAGLSSAQHKWEVSKSDSRRVGGQDLMAPYKWICKGKVFKEEYQMYDEEDEVNVLHPVFVVPEGAAEDARDYYAALGDL